MKREIARKVCGRPLAVPVGFGHVRAFREEGPDTYSLGVFDQTSSQYVRVRSRITEETAYRYGTLMVEGLWDGTLPAKAEGTGDQPDEISATSPLPYWFH